MKPKPKRKPKRWWVVYSCKGILSSHINEENAQRRADYENQLLNHYRAKVALVGELNKSKGINENKN